VEPEPWGGPVTSAFPLNPASASTRPLPWQDAKRHLWLLGVLVPVLACACIGAFAWGRSATQAWALWVIPALLFVLVPVLGWCVRSDSSNPAQSAAPALEADRYCQRLVILVVPFQILATVAGACGRRLGGGQAAFVVASLAGLDLDGGWREWLWHRRRA
jgi:hypothetical protein